MEIRCTHCRKEGRVWFERTTVYTENGPALDVIRCLNCSQWIKSRPLKPEPTTRPVTRAESDMSASERVKKQREKYIAKTSAECQMPGCTGRYLPVRNKFGLCKNHGGPLYGWLSHRRRRGKAGTPPVALVNGEWIKRGDPLPGIPGNRPAAPPVEEPARQTAKTAPKSRRKPRRKPDEKKITAFEMDELRSLANRGSKAASKVLAMIEGDAL